MPEGIVFVARRALRTCQLSPPGLIFVPSPLTAPMRLLLSLLLFLSVLITSTPAQAAEQQVWIERISTPQSGQQLGNVMARDTADGLVISPAISGLAPGAYGFHLHEKGSCEPGIKDGQSVAGLAAGGHWDPDNTGSHQGPFGEGHRGDLSRLVIDTDGSSTTPVVAPRLRVDDLKGRALIVHAGGDTYSDQPPLGGGGARIGCGVITQ